MIPAGATAVELIPGDPAASEGLAVELDRYAHGADEAAMRLRALDDGGIWFGEAADAFRARLTELPVRLIGATEAFGTSAQALRHQGGELRAAQATAAQVADLAAQAQQESAHYAQQVADYETAAAAGAAAGPVPPPVDPGAETMAQAERTLAGARQRADEAAQYASHVLHAQADLAPGPLRGPRPLIPEGSATDDFLKGIGESLWGAVKFVYHSTVYGLVDPQGWWQHWKGIAGGLAYGFTHPVEFGKAIIDWETFQENKARWLGHLAGDVIFGVATLGVGLLAKGGVRTLRKSKRLQDAREEARREPERGSIGKDDKGSDAETPLDTKVIDDPQKFDPNSFRGRTPDEIRSAIPDNWTQGPSKTGGGEVYADPEHHGRQIRIMPGYPGNRPDPLTHGPYAVVTQNGNTYKIPLAGNPTLN